MKNGSKIIALDALRGIAAIIVVFHHFMLGFLPQYDGFLPGYDLKNTLIGNPLFFFLNGSAMVVIFFVLSGHVLSRRSFVNPDPAYIIGAVFKRWFRLFPLVLASVLISYVLFSANLYAFGDAAELSTSPWLGAFAYGGRHQGESVSLFSALYQGFFDTFLTGHSSFNTNLWTMKYEFYGSMLTFLASLLFVFFRRWFVCIILVIVVFLLKREPYYAAFLIGVFGTMASLEHLYLNPWMAALLLVLGVYFCGFAIQGGAEVPVGAYSWIEHLHIKAEPGVLMGFFQIIGAFLFLIVFGTQNIVSRQFSGPVSRLLGQISFPLYLVHTLVICSFSSIIYVRMNGAANGVVAAMVVLVFTLIPLVAALAWLDQKWLKIIGDWHFPNKVLEKISPYILK